MILLRAHIFLSDRPWTEHVFGYYWLPMADRREQAAVLALVTATEKGESWHETATLIESRGSATLLIEGAFEDLPIEERRRAEKLIARLSKDELDEYQRLIERLSFDGVRLITILDPDYPQNLREVFNRPPFLFVRGRLSEGDARSVAVVGTRRASPKGISHANELAGELASREVTVLSGLAAGIDTAAHRAALYARGRTVAVVGTGIERAYPKENEALSKQIVDAGGAIVSQFWPDAPPTQYSFPMRNVVMSGMAVGTVVIEASSTSGAKMQARLALEHGKRLFLIRDLVMQEEWAKKYSKRAGTTIVESVGDILKVLDQESMASSEQLSFL